jgi:transposase
VTFYADELARSEHHLRIGFESGSRFPDETNELCPVHDTVERQRNVSMTLRHML